MSLETELRKEFAALAQSFDGFETALISKKTVRKDDNDHRIQVLVKNIGEIEVSLSNESRRRKETAIAMEAVGSDTFLFVPIRERDSAHRPM